MPSAAIEKIKNDNEILIQLTNKLYQLNSIKKILIATRDIIYALNRPLSHINLLTSDDKSTVFAVGEHSYFINSLTKLAGLTGSNLILSDVFDFSIKKSKIIQEIIKKKEIIIGGGKVEKVDFINIYSSQELLDDFILCNPNLKKIAKKLDYKIIFKMIDYKYILIVPFYNNAGTFGYFTIIGGKKDKPLTLYDLNIFLSIRNILSNAIKNFEYKQLLLDNNKNLEEKNRELARKNKEIEQLEEIERENISQLLHDTIAQMLAAEGISLNLLRKDLNSLKGINKKNKNALDTIQKRIGHLVSQNKNILKITRNIYKTYSPDKIQQKGLLAVLKENITDLETLYNLHIRSEFPDQELSIDVFISSTTYKIIQECFYNILKHSKAKKVDLKIHTRNNHLYVFLRDYGIGFDISQIADNETAGIRGMRRKINVLKGRLNIYSSPKKGTIVYFKIPLFY